MIINNSSGEIHKLCGESFHLCSESLFHHCIPPISNDQPGLGKAGTQ